MFELYRPASGVWIQIPPNTPVYADHGEGTLIYRQTGMVDDLCVGIGILKCDRKCDKRYFTSLFSSHDIEIQCSQFTRKHSPKLLHSLSTSVDMLEEARQQVVKTREFLEIKEAEVEAFSQMKSKQKGNTKGLHGLCRLTLVSKSSPGRGMRVLESREAEAQELEQRLAIIAQKRVITETTDEQMMPPTVRSFQFCVGPELIDFKGDIDTWLEAERQRLELQADAHLDSEVLEIQAALAVQGSRDKPAISQSNNAGGISHPDALQPDYMLLDETRDVVSSDKEEMKIDEEQFIAAQLDKLDEQSASDVSMELTVVKSTAKSASLTIASLEAEEAKIHVGIERLRGNETDQTGLWDPAVSEEAKEQIRVLLKAEGHKCRELQTQMTDLRQKRQRKAEDNIQKTRGKGKGKASAPVDVSKTKSLSTTVSHQAEIRWEETDSEEDKAKARGHFLSSSGCKHIQDFLLHGTPIPFECATMTRALAFHILTNREKNATCIFLSTKVSGRLLVIDGRGVKGGTIVNGVPHAKVEGSAKDAYLARGEVTCGCDTDEVLFDFVIHKTWRAQSRHSDYQGHEEHLLLGEPLHPRTRTFIVQVFTQATGLCVDDLYGDQHDVLLRAIKSLMGRFNLTSPEYLTLVVTGGFSQVQYLRPGRSEPVDVQSSFLPVWHLFCLCFPPSFPPGISSLPLLFGTTGSPYTSWSHLLPRVHPGLSTYTDSVKNSSSEPGLMMGWRRRALGSLSCSVRPHADSGLHGAHPGPNSVPPTHAQLGLRCAAPCVMRYDARRLSLGKSCFGERDAATRTRGPQFFRIAVSWPWPRYIRHGRYGARERTPSPLADRRSEQEAGTRAVGGAASAHGVGRGRRGRERRRGHERWRAGEAASGGGATSGGGRARPRAEAGRRAARRCSAARRAHEAGPRAEADRRVRGRRRTGGSAGGGVSGGGATSGGGRARPRAEADRRGRERRRGCERWREWRWGHERWRERRRAGGVASGGGQARPRAEAGRRGREGRRTGGAPSGGGATSGGGHYGVRRRGERTRRGRERRRTGGAASGAGAASGGGHYGVWRRGERMRRGHERRRAGGARDGVRRRGGAASGGASGGGATSGGGRARPRAEPPAGLRAEARPRALGIQEHALMSWWCNGPILRPRSEAPCRAAGRGSEWRRAWRVTRVSSAKAWPSAVANLPTPVSDPSTPVSEPLTPMSESPTPSSDAPDPDPDPEDPPKLWTPRLRPFEEDAQSFNQAPFKAAFERFSVAHTTRSVQDVLFEEITPHLQTEYWASAQFKWGELLSGLGESDGTVEQGHRLFIEHQDDVDALAEADTIAEECLLQAQMSYFRAYAPPAPDFCWLDDLDRRDTWDEELSLGASSDLDAEDAMDVDWEDVDVLDTDYQEADAVPDFVQEAVPLYPSTSPEKSYKSSETVAPEELPYFWAEAICDFFFPDRDVDPDAPWSKQQIVDYLVDMRALGRAAYTSDGFQSALEASGLALALDEVCLPGNLLETSHPDVEESFRFHNWKSMQSVQTRMHPWQHDPMAIFMFLTLSCFQVNCKRWLVPALRTCGMWGLMQMFDPQLQEAMWESAYHHRQILWVSKEVYRPPLPQNTSTSTLPASTSVLPASTSDLPASPAPQPKKSGLTSGQRRKQKQRERQTAPLNTDPPKPQILPDSPGDVTSVNTCPRCANSSDEDKCIRKIYVERRNCKYLKGAAITCVPPEDRLKPKPLPKRRKGSKGSKVARWPLVKYYHPFHDLEMQLVEPRPHVQALCGKDIVRFVYRDPEKGFKEKIFFLSHGSKVGGVRYKALSQDTLHLLQNNHRLIQVRAVRRRKEMEAWAYGTMTPSGSRQPMGGRKGDGYGPYPDHKGDTPDDIKALFRHALDTDILIEVGSTIYPDLKKEVHALTEKAELNHLGSLGLSTFACTNYISAGHDDKDISLEDLLAHFKSLFLDSITPKPSANSEEYKGGYYPCIQEEKTDCCPEDYNFAMLEWGIVIKTETNTVW
ncbi:hypothetical protein B0H10DRAFT_1942445 [Mycena sp. CBHHK59/15]|nr:hypothetical protein B0H10DRAFT_1942445 [Mycena sp. CBHHK59/15]